MAQSEHVFGSWVTDYINSADVRKVLHIDASIEKFEQCSKVVGDNYHYQNEASEWIYKVLKGAGIRMFHYSGDTDGAVPTAGTKRWIQDLDWDIEETWRPWKTNAQVSGFVQ